MSHIFTLVTNGLEPKGLGSFILRTDDNADHAVFILE